MKKYIAVLEIEDDEEIIDARVTYFYSNKGISYKATEKMELKEEKEDAKNKTYEDGLIEAWELARDIILADNTTFTRLRKNVFGDDAVFDIIRKYSASEVIKKIREYEEIKVGDEVKWQNGLGVIIEYDGYSTTVMKPNGTATIVYNETVLKKTGRHFPQIEEVLKQIQEDK